MKTAGIIAEYNPFHNGHHYHIEQTRAGGATHIVAVMSGSFVQRGEPALFSKWERAEAALRGGVDLVLELPAPYALGSAERFASGAVALLKALGCVELLSFGSESGELPLLEQTAKACLEAERSDIMAVFLKKGLPYPAARMQAVEQFFPEGAALLREPNNTLGIEYCKAILQQGKPFSAYTVLREGVGHDADEAAGELASASYLRRLYQEGEEITPWVPFDCYTASAGQERLEPALLWRLRGMRAADFALLPDVTEGLENRLTAAAQEAESVADFLERVKTKRYTHARLRRILWYAMLGIRKTDYEGIPYLRILGFNPRGEELLKKAKKTASLPLVSRFTELGRIAPRFAELEQRATDLWGIAAAPIQPGGQDYTRQIVRID